MPVICLAANRPDVLVVRTILYDLLIPMIVSKRTVLPHRNKIAFILTILMIPLMGISTLFTAFALYQYLLNTLSPSIAALLTGLLGLMLTLIVGILVWHLSYKSQTAAPVPYMELGKNVQFILKTVCDELEEPVRQNPKMAVAIAVLAGFLSVNDHFKS